MQEKGLKNYERSQWTELVLATVCVPLHYIYLVMAFVSMRQEREGWTGSEVFVS
jgi:hypothetical protein